MAYDSFVEALRRYAESLPPGGKGWLAAVRDAHVGRALAMLHGEPCRATSSPARWRCRARRWPSVLPRWWASRRCNT